MINEVFHRALQLHQCGQLRDAEIGYRQVLQQNPDHADALHLLGVIAHQCGNSPDAKEWIQRAIEINPNSASYYSNLADVHRTLGQFDAAITCCEQALEIDPQLLDAQNNLALALLDMQRFDEAETTLREVLKRNPQFVAAHNNIGHALREQGRTGEAIEAYRAAVRLAPEIPEAHNNLGQLLLEAGEIDDALIHCREAVRLKQDFAQAHSNLGNVLREQGKLESARACYQEALRLNDRIGMIHNNMAQLLQEEGQFEEAVGWYHQALALQPQWSRFHANLASALTDLERYDEAIKEYREAIALRSDFAEAYNSLGHVYRELQDNDRAIKSIREAIRINPSLAAAHNNLGQVLVEIGRLDESLVAFREAIRHDPKIAAAWNSIATHHRRHLRDDDLRQIQSLLKQPYLKDDQYAALHSSLAHIYDADKIYDRAAEAAGLANQFQLRANLRRGQTYWPDEHSRFIDQLMSAFDADYFRDIGSVLGSGSELPVFIVGLPRSGTTLTEQIVASHPAVFGAGELRFARRSFDSLNENAGQHESGIEPGPAINPLNVRQHADDYLARLRALDPQATRIVDKMPDNYLYLGWIATMFPGARIIHCRRDLRDVALSCWMTSFKSIRWANDADHIANRIQNYQQLMNHWKSDLPIQMLELNYEETVSNLPDVARRLVNWIDLPWNDQCLEFHQADRPIRTASVTQVRQPIYSRSVGRWKNYESYLPGLFGPLHDLVHE